MNICHATLATKGRAEQLSWSSPSSMAAPGHRNLIRRSLAAQELISAPTPAPCPKCAQIPGTLSIKDASSEQISFTLIRTRKIRVCKWGGEERGGAGRGVCDAQGVWLPHSQSLFQSGRGQHLGTQGGALSQGKVENTQP